MSLNDEAISEPGFPPGGVPEMKNFHRPTLFVEAIVNANRTMEKLPHICRSPYWRSDAGKGSQQAHVVEKGSSKASGRAGVVGVDVIENGLEIG
jgi:hypothetical protein